MSCQHKPTHYNDKLAHYKPGRGYLSLSRRFVVSICGMDRSWRQQSAIFNASGLCVFFLRDFVKYFERFFGDMMFHAFGILLCHL